MRLLHLSDTHLHALGAATFHPEIESAARLDLVLAAVRDHGPFDAIALTGDICDDASVAGAVAVREKLAAAYPAVPVLAVPGNHDHTSSVRQVFGEPVTHLGPWRVIAAATNVPEQTEGQAGPSVQALHDALAEGGDAPLLLLQHHPLRSRSTHEWFVLKGAEDLERALADVRRPVVLLTGHTHQAFQSKEDAVHHIGAPSTYYAIEHDGADWKFAESGTGALILDLTHDHVESVTLVLA